MTMRIGGIDQDGTPMAMIDWAPRDRSLHVIERDAHIVGNYRYWLRRVWDRKAAVLPWVLLNPSVANAERDDPTTKVAIGRAARLGYGGILIYNLFAYISTDPRELGYVGDPVGPENDETLAHVPSMFPVVCGWGDGALIVPERIQKAKNILRAGGCDLVCLGTTRAGQPRHPLRIPYSKPLEILL